MQPAHVICIKWGSLYTERDVNLLYAMVKRNVLRHELHFHCFTEDPSGLHPDIIVHPLPVMQMKNGNRIKYGYLKEAGLCCDNLAGLAGQRVLFFDLDVLITGTIDDMIDYPKGDDFYIINDWNTRGNHVGQASCYSWRVGTLGFIKEHFEHNANAVIDKYFTACQEYLSSMIISRDGKLNFWPSHWCRSFKAHALPPVYLRPWKEPTLPEGTKVLAFHGRPKIEDAIAGRWAPGTMPLYKRLYKTIRPSRWIANYWHE